MAKRFGDALAFASGGTTVAAVEQEEIPVPLRVDYSRFGVDGEYFRARVIAIHQNARRGLRAKWEMGKAFAEIRARSKHGEFGTILREEFEVDEGGLSMTSVYDMMGLFEQYPEFERIAGVGLSVARLLTTGTTPQAAKDEILARAQQGERVGHKAAGEIVERHKRPDRRAERRALSLDEAIALVWWKVKVGAGQRADDEVRLRWLQENEDAQGYRASLRAWWGDGSEGLRLEEAVFGRAYGTVMAELEARIAFAAAKAARRAAVGGGGRDDGNGGDAGDVVIDGEVTRVQALPQALAARGWEVRSVGAGPKVYGFRWPVEGRERRVTPPCVDVAEVAARAWAIEEEGVKVEDWVEVRVSRGTARALGRALGDEGVRGVLGEVACAELAAAFDNNKWEMGNC